MSLLRDPSFTVPVLVATAVFCALFTRGRTFAEALYISIAAETVVLVGGHICVVIAEGRR